MDIGVKPHAINTFEIGENNNTSTYNLTSTPLTWCLDLCVNELMFMKERIQALETRSHAEDNKIKAVIEDNTKLIHEKNLLKEQVRKLQFNKEKGEYELFLLKKALERMKVIGKYIISEEDQEEIQIKEIQSRMENMELKGD